MNYTLYTDGSCTNNGQEGSFGGWACIITSLETASPIELCGAEKPTTNNRMEMMGVIQGLEYIGQIKSPVISVKVVADSKYVLDAFSQNWISKWRANGWRGSTNKPVKNLDLWHKLIALVEKYNPTWEHVHGHTGHEFNERCDVLAAKIARENNDSF